MFGNTAGNYAIRSDPAQEKGILDRREEENYSATFVKPDAKNYKIGLAVRHSIRSIRATSQHIVRVLLVQLVDFLFFQLFTAPYLPVLS